MNIADKYAVAYLNTIGSSLSLEDIRNLMKAAYFLQTHRRALFLLQVPVIAQEIKHEGLLELCERFSLAQSVKRLVVTLLKAKRAHLIAKIFDAIVYHYNQSHAIHVFTVTSSSDLHSTYKKQIEAFIDQRVAGTKEYRYTVDASLIAGVRVESDTLLWEFSIDKQLRDLYHVERW